MGDSDDEQDAYFPDFPSDAKLLQKAAWPHQFPEWDRGCNNYQDLLGSRVQIDEVVRQTVCAESRYVLADVHIEGSEDLAGSPFSKPAVPHSEGAVCSDELCGRINFELLDYHLEGSEAHDYPELMPGGDLDILGGDLAVCRPKNGDTDVGADHCCTDYVVQRALVLRSFPEWDCACEELLLALVRYPCESNDSDPQNFVTAHLKGDEVTCDSLEAPDDSILVEAGWQSVEAHESAQTFPNLLMHGRFQNGSDSRGSDSRGSDPSGSDNRGSADTTTAPQYAVDERGDDESLAGGDIEPLVKNLDTTELPRPPELCVLFEHYLTLIDSACHL